MTEKQTEYLELLDAYTLLELHDKNEEELLDRMDVLWDSMSREELDEIEAKLKLGMAMENVLTTYSQICEELSQ
jgi:hypothetical protein